MNATRLSFRCAVLGAVLGLGMFPYASRADVGDSIGTAAVTGLGPTPGSYAMPIERIGDGPFGVNDVDIYRIEAQRGQLITAITSYPGSGILADTILRLFDDSGKLLTMNDDTNGLYSRIDAVAQTSGSYYIGVSSYKNFFYDPNVAGSGSDASFAGDYRLDLRLEGDVEASPGAKPQQFVRGHGFWNQTAGVPFGGNQINEVSIIAWVDAAGVAHGSATWVGGEHTVPGKGGRTLTGYPWILDVTNFVRVDANTVFVEGVVTQSGQNPSDVGSLVQWTVRDFGAGASGARDTVNDFPIEGGNFVVGP
jgi:hypothetical protein